MNQIFSWCYKVSVQWKYDKLYFIGKVHNKIYNGIESCYKRSTMSYSSSSFDVDRLGGGKCQGWIEFKMKSNN